MSAKWVVVRSDGLSDDVDADRAWVDEGAAGFSEEIEPDEWQLVACYAPGQWQRVHLVTEVTE